ncbi:unnamed protein product, partial [Iphiclides podalirius]
MIFRRRGKNKRVVRGSGGILTPPPPPPPPAPKPPASSSSHGHRAPTRCAERKAHSLPPAAPPPPHHRVVFRTCACAAMRTSASPRRGNGQVEPPARLSRPASPAQCARLLAAGGSVRSARTHAPRTRCAERRDCEVPTASVDRPTYDMSCERRTKAARFLDLRQGPISLHGCAKDNVLPGIVARIVKDKSVPSAGCVGYDAGECLRPGGMQAVGQEWLMRRCGALPASPRGLERLLTRPPAPTSHLLQPPRSVPTRLLTPRTATILFFSLSWKKDHRSPTPPPKKAANLLLGAILTSLLFSTSDHNAHYVTARLVSAFKL